MAESGKTISRKNFTASWAQTVTLTGSTDYYVYICAACWCVQMEYGSIFNERIFTADYWNGTAWVNGITWNKTMSQTTYFFAHNRDEGNVNGGSCHNEYPLWRLHLQNDHSSATDYIYAGNYALAETTATGEPFYYPSGKKIQSRGAYSSPIYLAGSSANDDYALNTAFNRTNRRGSQILASDDSELIYYPY